MPEDSSKSPAESVAKPEPEVKLSKEEKKAKDKEKDAEFNAATTVHVKLYSPFQVYYDDEAESVSAENATGPFDILPRHHNFITLLVPCEVDIRSAKGGDKKIKINRGVMHVHRNNVTIFLDV